jgi:hypothetical protein
MILRILICLILPFAAIHGLQIQMIKQVPDYSQPPSTILPSTIDSNFCSPFAYLNIIAYWELIQGHSHALGMMAGLSPAGVAEYIGWFMDTNNQGSPMRMNGTGLAAAAGTYAIDQSEGIMEYTQFDPQNSFGFPYSIPAQKVSFFWDISPVLLEDFPLYMTEINDGNPVKLDFLHWHIIPTGDTIFDSGPPQDTIFIYKWGPVDPTTAFDPEAPWEEWNLEIGENGIGHAVTGVGYIMDTLEFAIVHDNWANTPKNIAIPWHHPMIPFQLVSSMILVHLPPVVIHDGEQSNRMVHVKLNQNYPNPFNPVTTIHYQLPMTSRVRLTVHNILGQEIEILVNRKMPAGYHQIVWKAKNFPSGIYYCKIQAGDYSDVKKMVLVK